MPLPSPPANLTAAPDGVGDIDLSWTRTSPGTFNVYRGTTPGGEGSNCIGSGITETSYEDSGVVSGGVYYYEAITVLNGVESKPPTKPARSVPETRP